MSPESEATPAMHRMAVLTVGIGVLLVWWGAAVTTKDVGLAVPDWPLCYRRINPEGWWRVMALMLEHGHRWLAAIVFWLVFGFFSWQWFRTDRRAARRIEWVALLGALMAVIALAAMAASPFRRQPALFWPAAVLGVGLTCWLLHGLLARQWPDLLKFSALALFTVELQAVLGGMRVTEMSDAFGILHGCLGQLFYCLLLLLALRSSSGWGRSPASLPRAVRGAWARQSSLLFGAVVLQLVWGAAIRHFHRVGLPAPDLLTTNGRIFPGFGEAAEFFFFLHKFWALAVLGLAVRLAWMARAKTGGTQARPLPALALTILSLLLVQGGLGILVVLTTTSFWVTNFHVLNGLAILACTFTFVVKVMAAGAQSDIVTVRSSEPAA